MFDYLFADLPRALETQRKSYEDSGDD